MKTHIGPEYRQRDGDSQSDGARSLSSRAFQARPHTSIFPILL